ncbi:MAG: XRE family transcriptional regulator [Bdellovibrionales bacterium]|nr:XRE family transcriptional regulator [Bdellovibrionales bacterium]
MIELMRDKAESIKKQLIAAIRAEIEVLEKTMTQTAIAKKAGVYQPFLSALRNMNEKSLKTVALQKLIPMAEKLGLDVELIIRKNGERIK